MSGIIADQNLTLNTPVTLPMGDFPLAYVSWIVLINASPFACKCSFGGNQFFMPAWYYYPVDVGGNAPQAATVIPYLQTIPGVGFAHTLSTIIYMQGEEPPSKLASPLGGGPVDLTVATSLTSTNQPLGNTIVFIEPVTDTSASGTVQITNTGFITLGDTVTGAGGLTIQGPTGDKAVLVNGLLDLYGASGSNINIGLSGQDPTVINGSVGGTVTFKTPLWGVSLKILLVIFAAYNSASNAVFNFPTPVITRGLYLSSYNGTSTCTFGTADVVTSLGSGTARGGDITEGQIFANSFGSIPVTTASTFTANATGGTAVNGAVLVIG